MKMNPFFTGMLLVLAGLTILSCIPANAQNFDNARFFFRSDYACPTDPAIFNDYWGWGWGGGAGISVPVGQWFEGQVAIDYTRFAFDKDRLDLFFQLPSSGSSVSGATATSIAVTVQLKYPQKPHGFLPFYILAGVGYENASVSEGAVTYTDLQYTEPSRSSSGIIVVPGAGIEYALGQKLSLFCEMRYLNALSADTQFYSNQLPLSLGFRSSF